MNIEDKERYQLPDNGVHLSAKIRAKQLRVQLNRIATEISNATGNLLQKLSDPYNSDQREGDAASDAVEASVETNLERSYAT